VPARTATTATRYRAHARWALLALTLTTTAAALAQSGKGELFGVVRDASSLPVSDAAVTANALETGAAFTTATNADGEFHLLGLPSGSYTSRHPVRGPAYNTFDLMVGKTLSVSEKLTAEFRAEAFNLTNTPPWGDPNGDFGTPAFGSITNAGDPRVFELVLKLRF
jgi:hypothetical protein